ncbi:geranylgeranylglycerol-phosphate geranylgeranyltransferase [Winogradskyella sp. 3972H.M.0a.05]|uniref:geranylgeranylglycerol-phosphate geranylgeranyltransferase n=1 Tax=Winogradskyella sp. 3972H.M.0a.05 TaxID=2950277 RepID=UPI0033953CCA
MNYLNLIRWKNLLLIALTQYLIKYALFEPFNVTTTLNDYGFALLVLTCLCIAAAGYVINDLFDIEADTINKPNKVLIGKSISEKAAFNLFIALNIVGVGLGFYISQVVGKSVLFPIFVAISAILYVYSSYLKHLPLVGNIIISIVVASTLLIVGIFELLPVMTVDNRATQITFFDIIFDYAIFAFMINLIRELIKDIEDVDGDHKMGSNTLPIAIGRDRAKKVAFVLSLVPIGVITYYVITYLYHKIEAVIYFLVLVVAPLIYVVIKIYTADSKANYKHISTMLKLVMLTGLLSLLLYQFILK